MPVSRAVKRLVLWLPPIACMATIFYFSSQVDPAPQLTTRVSDKLLHLAAYALLGALFCRALLGEGMRPFGTIIAAILLTSLYGASDEFHQSFVPTRHPDVADWIVDTLGASIGAIGHILGPRIGSVSRPASRVSRASRRPRPLRRLPPDR